MILWSPVFLIILTLLMGIGAWALFMWAVKSGQFDDIEGPKYRIFDDDDDDHVLPPDDTNGGASEEKKKNKGEDEQSA